MKSVELCRCCKSSTSHIFTALIIGREAEYFDCPNCGYVQTQQPFWLDTAYKSAINDCDTGIMIRNQTNVSLILATLTMLGKLDGAVVDYAGGYGILVRLLRDRGINALWSDPYCENLLARGFQ